MKSQVSGEMGSGTNIDDLPMSSVVYIGRGSFRMEAVALQDVPGAVQPIIGVVTAPLHAPANDRFVDRSAARPAERDRHDVRALFSSQLSIPRLAAPTGSASLQAPPVAISRAMLATLGGVVLLCGIVVGTAARHLLASPAPLAVAPAPAPLALAPALATAPVVVAVPVPAALPSVPVVETAPPAPPPVNAVPAPVKIRAHAQPVKPAATPVRHAAPATPVAPAASAPPSDAKSAPAKPWVDPWAN